MKFKRTLFILHRWFGVVMCLFFALWFSSGIIMMYVEYPELTEKERLATLPAIDMEKVLLSVEDAITIAQLTGDQQHIKLSAIADRPAYQIQNEFGSLSIIFADTGEIFSQPNRENMIAVVKQSGFWSPEFKTRYDKEVNMDQWTVSSSLNQHRPLHKIEIGDHAGTFVYISNLTGQIVRDTHRNERFWNWLGSTVHWIYPMQLRRHASLWVDIIIYLSLAAIVSVITGGIIGFMRLRIKKRYKNNKISPYKNIAKWHHILGLSSLIFVSTFVFSGLMSMSPWGIFDSSSSQQIQLSRYTGGNISKLQNFPEIDWQAQPNNIKEVTWHQIAGQGYLVFSYSADNRQAFLGKTERKQNHSLLQQLIKQSLTIFLPDHNIVSLETLQEYDSYYYSRHNRYRPLPVYRVKFDDVESIWFDIDQSTGTVIARHTNSSRLERWLYNGMHSLDFSFLIKNGPLWDITVISLCIIGFIFSITAVILGWRRIRR